MNKGIITAADSTSFSAFQLFNYSLRKHNSKIPLALFDIGLSEQEKGWCRRNKIKLINYKNPIVPKDYFMWQTWNKPDYINRSPFEYTLWLDCDIIIYKNLTSIFKKIKNKIFCVKDHFGTDVKNKKELYKLYPVGKRLEKLPNGGVLGLCKSRKKDMDFLNKYLFLTREVAKDINIKNFIKWWDQGAIQWALESSKNTSCVYSERSYNDSLYNPELKIDNPKQLYDSLRNRKSMIVHLGGCPKPYYWFEKNIKDKPIENKIKMFVVGHIKECFSKIEKSSSIEEINLNKIDVQNTQQLAENQFFLTDYIFRCSESYAGLITYRYKEKYNIKLKNILGIKKHLNKNCIFTPHLSTKNWFDYSINHHPGIEKYIREISKEFDMPIRRKKVFWANNFICHKFVFSEFIYKFRSIFHYMNSKYGYDFDYKVDAGQEHRKAAFLYERVAMLYFSNRDDLRVLPLPFGIIHKYETSQIFKSKSSSSSMSFSKGISQ